MALLDLLGRRWILRLLWELRVDTLGFRALQARCERMSPSVLSQRLQDLHNAALVEHEEHGDYRLTPHGKQLVAALLPLLECANSLPPAAHSSLKKRSAPRSRAG